MSEAQILYRLQQIDTQLDKARERIREIEIILTDNVTLQQAELTLLKAEQRLETEKKTLEKAEQSVQQQYVKISQSEAALYGGKIRIPKELQDLQSEVAALKRYLVKLEDTQLEHMLAVEEAHELKKQAGLEYDRANSAWIEKTAHLKDELSRIQTQLSRLDSERAAALGSIPENLLSVYDTLRKQRNGVAVVKILGGSCAACGTTLTPAVLQSAQFSSTIVKCPTCNRVLYPG